LQERPLLIFRDVWRIMLKCIKNWWDIVECICLRQNRRVWLAAVNTVLKFRVLLNVGNFLLPEQLTHS